LHPLPHLATAKQRNADVAVHIQLVAAFGQAQLHAIDLAVFRIEDFAAVPYVAIFADVPHDHHALDGLILALTVAFLADRMRTIVGKQHFLHLGFELSIALGDLDDGLGLAGYIIDLPPRAYRRVVGGPGDGRTQQQTGGDGNLRQAFHDQGAPYVGVWGSLPSHCRVGQAALRNSDRTGRWPGAAGIMNVLIIAPFPMTQANEALVRRILGDLIDPHTGAPLADSIRAVGVDGARVSVDIQLGYPAAGAGDSLAQQAKQMLENDAAIEAAVISMSSRIHAHKVQGTLAPLANVKNIIAVASGKGGVGKSTVSVNLALALAAEGAKVGILDADIYGPSQPRMLGIQGRPESPDGKTIIPMTAHGLQAMSIGLLVDEETPMIWRGPMVTQAMMQLLNDTRWDMLDYLIIDLPPGTGDIQLTLSQKVPVAGAVIVTTPQDIALLDARKALKMFEKVEVPVLGIVENMATHVCTNCGHEEHIFGAGGGERMAEQYQVPYLGSLPLDIRIREQADGGNPTVAAMPDSDLAARYREIARNTAGRLARQPRNKSLGLGKIIVQGQPAA